MRLFRLSRPSRSLVILPLLALSLMLTGCNTMEGLGRDISKAGDSLEEAAK